jgi:hypothetical protein
VGIVGFGGCGEEEKMTVVDLDERISGLKMWDVRDK